MRHILWAVALMVWATTGLIPQTAAAATYTYTFSGNFASSRSTLNNNGNALITGGTLSGFVTFDTTLTSFAILDYHFETMQPNRYGGALHNSVFDFDDQGISGANPNAVTKTSVVIGNNLLALLDYTSGPFSGLTWASSYRRLDFAFDDSLLGASSLAFTMLDSRGPCFQNLRPFRSNPCGPLSSRQSGVFTATLLTDTPPPPPTVPLPAGIVLLLTGLAGLGALRRR